jgi:hypothetical protein
LSPEGHVMSWWTVASSVDFFEHSYGVTLYYTLKIVKTIYFELSKLFSAKFSYKKVSHPRRESVYEMESKYIEVFDPLYGK